MDHGGARVQTTAWTRWTSDGDDVFAAPSWPAPGAARRRRLAGGELRQQRRFLLLSPPFRPRGGGVRLIHHFDLVPDSPGVGPDGAVIEAVLGDGTVVPLEPVDRYPGFVPSDGVTSLAGRGAFVDAGDLDDDDRPLWSVDDFDLSGFPDEDLRLRFRLVSDPAWRGRGWFLHSLTRTGAPVSQRPVLNEDAGTWSFPGWMDTAQTAGATAAVQTRRTVEDPWTDSPVAR